VPETLPAVRAEGDPGQETLRELAEQLRKCTLFDGLAESQLTRVARIGQRCQFERNAKIFSEGDAGSKVYLILSGAVRISREVPGMGEEALAVLHASSAFGEMALIDGSARSADALAHEACELFVLDGQELTNLMFVDRSLANELLWKLVRQLTSRLRQTNDKMTFLSITGRFE
jgi:CRP/FNR family cyclic AMP-dependent transcriptional regulator